MYYLKLRTMPLPKVKLSATVKDVKLTHGWLLPALVEMDSLLYGRWEYWLRAQYWNPDSIPDSPIPQIDWQHSGQAQQMLIKCLDTIPQSSSWQGWSSWDYFRYFLKWLLFGFGHHGQSELPKEPGGCEGASDRLYQLFQLGTMQIFPDDYFGNLLAESSYGKRQGFYPTPMSLCQMMAQMTFINSELDNRTARCGDPCCGTGRFPLVMSNYSLCVIAQDIDETLIMATLVNAYLYAPWVACPIWWLGGDLLVGNSLLQDSARSVLHFDRSDSNESISKAQRIEQKAIERLETISNGLTEQAVGNEGAVEYLSDTEHDPENQWTPILKRRKKSKSNQEAEIIGYQGSLF